MPDPIVIRASFPDIQSAIRISGAANGARLLLDAPEIDMADVVKLLALRGGAFYVSFIPIPPAEPAPASVPARSEWRDSPEVLP